MKASKEHKPQQSRVLSSSIIERKQNNVFQLFKIPDGLEQIKTDVTEVADDMSKIGTPTDELYGSQEWANDTRWATKRKLEEWDLVKYLYSQSSSSDISNSIIGFGIDDMNESDGLVRNLGGEYIWAGENKLITGKFTQVSENIHSALSQLCTGKRASYFSGANLVARIVIAPSSEAARHWSQMTPIVQKGMITRWNKLLMLYYDQGIGEVWKTKNTLKLFIYIGTNLIYSGQKE